MLVALLLATTVVACGSKDKASDGAEGYGKEAPAPQADCGPIAGQPLVEPIEISQQGGVLTTQLVVREKTHQCVPFWDANANSGNGAWVGKTMSLRTYGWPTVYGQPIDPENENDPNTTWGFPAPTFVLNKASAPGATDGSRFVMDLYNRMEPNVALDDQCDENAQPGADVFPNCFHGDNTTNFHFHGFHVSPQPHQDYVLLALRPKGTTTPAMAMGRMQMVDTGDYDFALDPLIWQQAEGTHWYHPHKHGSTALQVLNGMSGTFKIRGPFDDWLEEQYPFELEDKVLVLQQIGEQLPYFNSEFVPPNVVVNGQAAPVITMKLGEIQRWRFVGATMQASAQLQIDFRPTGGDEGLTVKQIAQDGIQFADANYQSQPLLQNGISQFNLAPGNRADFLVQAPMVAGRYALTQRVYGYLEEKLRDRVMANRPMAFGDNAKATGTNPPLLYVDVVQEPQPMPFPATLPAMPDYLQDITTVDRNRDVFFQMTGAPGTPPTFQIDGKAYDPDCADQTLKIGDAEEWHVGNDSNPLHPFHIHVNPFQVLDRGDGTQLPQPWVWQDTIALAAGAATQPATVTIRQRYDNYTGEFVLHCHFLGHEDRGMMQNVQTVCPDSGQYGHPSPGSSECSPGNEVAGSPVQSCTAP